MARQSKWVVIWWLLGSCDCAYGCVGIPRTLALKLSTSLNLAPTTSVYIEGPFTPIVAPTDRPHFSWHYRYAPHNTTVRPCAYRVAAQEL